MLLLKIKTMLLLKIKTMLLLKIKTMLLLKIKTMLLLKLKTMLLKLTKDKCLLDLTLFTINCQTNYIVTNKNSFSYHKNDLNVVSKLM